MGVRHRQFVIETVQYHPESVLSEEGDSVLSNFLKLRGGTWDENPSARIGDISLPPFPVEAPNGTPSQPPGSTSKKLPTILEKIHVQRLKDIELAKSTPGTSFDDLEDLLSINIAPPLIDVVKRMRTNPQTTPALMAEIKRASPSKGPIAMRANAASQAQTYALAGASVVSVLTEPTWFKGSLLDMRLARQAIDSLPNRPAVLRKDFIVDEYQIAEARLHGADTVLLIVAMLPIPRLRALYAYSKKLGMEPLVEVNNASEMEAALELGALMIGVNNRNLHTFEVDMQTTTRLTDMVKGRGVILCALSGISGPSDVRTYVEQGVNAVLIGEALMRADDPRAFIKELLGWTIPEDIKQEPEPPLVKICGIQTVEEALAAAQSGADMLGLMFVPSSKRRVSLDIACRISYAVRERRTQAEAEIPIASLESFIAKDEAQMQNSPWFTTHANRLEKSLKCGHARPQLVGVFQDQPLEYILEIVAAAQLDVVQLHGKEPLHWASQIPVPVVRVFHVGVDGEGLKDIAQPGLHKFILLDALRSDGLSGGSGKRVDLALARSVVDAGEIASKGSDQTASNGHVNGKVSAPVARLPIVLAGGLTPDNVAEAVATVLPWAVDVSSGVENPDGSGKDLEKLSAFIRAAKGLKLSTTNGSHPANMEEEPTPTIERRPSDIDASSLSASSKYSNGD